MVSDTILLLSECNTASMTPYGQAYQHYANGIIIPQRRIAPCLGEYSYTVVLATTGQRLHATFLAYLLRSKQPIQVESTGSASSRQH